jgi:hypothetical protein
MVWTLRSRAKRQGEKDGDSETSEEMKTKDKEARREPGKQMKNKMKVYYKFQGFRNDKCSFVVFYVLITCSSDFIEYRGSMFHRNVDIHAQKYTMPQPRIPQS